MATGDDEFLRKLQEAFKIEAQEHLAAMTSGSLELEKQPALERQRAIIETIFREAHSLKGAARAVNRTDIESVCQAIESVFAVWKRGQPDLAPETFDVLNRGIDEVTGLLALPEAAPDKAGVLAVVQQLRALEAAAQSHAGPPGEAAPPSSRLLPAEAAAAGKMPPAEIPRSEPQRPAVFDTVRIPMAKMDSLLLQAEEMIGVKLTTSRCAADLRDLWGSLNTWKKEWGKVQDGARNLPSSAETGRLLDFLEWNRSYMLSIEGRAMALAKSAEHDRRSVGVLVDDLLARAKNLVMLPFSTVLDLFPKLVRDLSRDQGKEVELLVHGTEVQIDKRILEEIKDALIHLARNAIDHGIEPPDTRTQRQKPARGALTIAISQVEGNKVEILISDDGRGIDIAKVKAVAVKNGVLTAEEAARRSDQDCLALIFHSGVTTSAILTEVSGRGLGMAIVHEKVEKLGGHVAIETQPGRSTSFRIHLPVTLATFKGLLVEAAGQIFVIPAVSVDRVVRVRIDGIKTVEHRETILLDQHPVSLARLDDVLGLPRREQGGNVLEAAVLGAREKRIAFVVDRVIGEQEVLVKTLGKPLVRVRNVAAGTVLGSGKPALILNVADLLGSAAKPRGTGVLAASESAAPRQSILVAEDSITSRMLLKNILESAGYKVTTAIDGADAFSTLKTQAFNAVVSDVEMPRMNGFDLAAKIRADKNLADLPVVLVTALESREDRERGIDVGANAYIVKSSFDQSNLLEVIRSLV